MRRKKRKPQTEKQKQASKENFAVMRLKGIDSIVRSMMTITNSRHYYQHKDIDDSLFYISAKARKAIALIQRNQQVRIIKEGGDKE